VKRKTIYKVTLAVLLLSLAASSDGFALKIDRSSLHAQGDDGQVVQED